MNHVEWAPWMWNKKAIKNPVSPNQELAGCASLARPSKEPHGDVKAEVSRWIHTARDLIARNQIHELPTLSEETRGKMKKKSWTK